MLVIDHDPQIGVVWIGREEADFPELLCELEVYCGIPTWKPVRADTRGTDEILASYFASLCVER